MRILVTILSLFLSLTSLSQDLYITEFDNLFELARTHIENKEIDSAIFYYKKSLKVFIPDSLDYSGKHFSS